MLRVFIPEIQKHRNETTFRPYINSSDYFRKIGIKFVFEGNSWDMAWIGQSSYMDKTLTLPDSVDKGIEYLEQFKGRDYILFDGQDSATLKGSVEVFSCSDAKYLLKNTLYSDFDDYRKFSTTGRIYWPLDLGDLYRPPLGQDFSRIKLSGTNWLSGVQFNSFAYSHAKKDIDVFAMFQYPAKLNYEWQIETSKYYTVHRKNCIEQLKLLPDHIKIVTAESGKVSLQEYYELMSRSKIVIAPFGYGEIAPRDVESAMLGCVLIKPDMSHIQTIPNVYNNPENYVSVDWNYSNLNTIIIDILNDYTNKQEYYVENFRNDFCREYTSEKMVTHIYDIIKSIEGYTI
jgi:hypothetical protein